jgi:FdhD protein
MTMRHPPQRAKSTQVVEWDAGLRQVRLDDLVGEEPLEIRVGDAALAVTMRTPGDDFELAAGFLFTEGVLSSAAQIARIAYGRGPDGTVSGNVVDVTLSGGPVPDLQRLERHFVAASSCGICGKASIDAVRARALAPPTGDLRIAPALLCRLPQQLRSAQQLFGRTGALHGAALFNTDGALLIVREDVGRHNAVDKLVGHAMLQTELPLSNRILLVSGRGGFEIIQKAVVAGVPFVACVSAPSSLAVQLAREMGLTLVGFLRDRRFVVYSGEARVAWDARIGGAESMTAGSGGR